MKKGFAEVFGIVEGKKEEYMEQRVVPLPEVF